MDSFLANLIVNGTPYKKVVLVFIFCTLFMQLGCRSVRYWQPGTSEYYKVRDLSEINKDEARKEFMSLPVSRQIDMYLYGIKYIEPDENWIVEFLAENGCDKLPDIYDRISDSDEEIDKAYLMEVVAAIDRNEHCVTLQDLNQLQVVGGKIQDNFHRARFIKALSELQR